MSGAISISDIMSKFDCIRIKHPRLEEAHMWFDTMRGTKRASPQSPKKFISIFAPAQSGKSMSVLTYIHTKVVDEVIKAGLFDKDLGREAIAKEQKLVLHLTLTAKATTKSFVEDVLVALGDPYPQGDERAMKRRVYDLMRKCGTELLVIDEIQHLSGDRRRKRSTAVSDATPVTDTMKVMLIRGLVPIVFVGIPEARHHLFGDPQLAERCINELDFKPLDLMKPKERKIFLEYCGRLSLKLHQHEIFEDETDLLNGDIPACLHIVSGGRIGTVSNLVLFASIIAFEQDARCITRDHLVQATDEWAIPKGVIDYNPFVNPRSVKVIKT
ncbi:AAA family ATPase [Ensifer adhaerens]